jgi:hypothetical protein
MLVRPLWLLHIVHPTATAAAAITVATVATADTSNRPRPPVAIVPIRFGLDIFPRRRFSRSHVSQPVL